jgi:hypothetical protein
MMTELIVELPKLDIGQYEGCEFVMSGGDAKLTLRFSELPDFGMSFGRVRWHQFTALPNCSADMIKTAYFRLVELKGSSALGFLHQTGSGAQEGLQRVTSLPDIPRRNRLS